MNNRHAAVAGLPRSAGQPARAGPRARASTPFKVKMVLILWVLLVFDPHWWLASLGVPQAIAARLYFIPLSLLALALAFEFSRMKTLVPLTIYAAYVVSTLPLAYNRGLAMPNTKLMLVTTVVSLALLTFIRSASHVRSVVLMYLLYRYVWWAAHGMAVGSVEWDPLIGNQDQFGSIMAMGVVSAGALAMAGTEKRFRRMSGGIALLCTAGLVSSFARGAFMVAGVSLLLLWYRSEGRRLAQAGLIVMIVVATAVAATLFANVDVARGEGVSRSWWAEITSVGDDIADEDAEDRRLIWRIGFRVFTEHPILGSGAGNWGAYAAQNFSGEFLGERFANPGRLYGRAMHNAFMQNLVEHGIIGFGLFLWMLADYFRRIAMIRRNTSSHDASLLTGLKTRMVATALEVSMVALLAAGMLYNVVNFWLYALVLTNALFHEAWLSQRRPQAVMMRR